MSKEGKLLIILCIAAVLLFCGCVGNNETKNNTTQKTQTINDTQTNRESQTEETSEISDTSETSSTPLTENSTIGHQPALKYVTLKTKIFNGHISKTLEGS